MEIKLHNAILWQYEPIVANLIKQGHEWNTDMWGRKPPHDAVHLHFKNNAVYQDALKAQKHISVIR